MWSPRANSRRCNESVYKCQCPGNAVRFAERMKTRYGTIERANAAWGTVFEDFGDVARQTEFRQFPRLWPDYMEFMVNRYAEVLAECRRFPPAAQPSRSSSPSPRSVRRQFLTFDPHLL